MKHIGIVACSADGEVRCHQSICREAEQLVGPHDHLRVTLDSTLLLASAVLRVASQ